MTGGSASPRTSAKTPPDELLQDSAIVEASGTYKKYMLTLLATISLFQYIDQAVIALFLEDIKYDLGLSDTQLGLITGLAFAVFYSVMGVPIGRWADTGNRVTIISVTMALWGGATAMCGIAANFVQLLLIRVGVAVGEAGCVPPAHSLIADFFSRSERSRAVGFYMMAGPLSVVVGYSAAGWLSQMFGWRTILIILGAPGMLLGLLAFLTLREPRKNVDGGIGRMGSGSNAPPFVSLFVAVRTLFAIRTFRYLVLCFVFATFFANGIAQWRPAFFIRSFGVEISELGFWLGLVGVSSVIGTYVGGDFGSRYLGCREDIQLRITGVIYFLFGILSAGVYLAPSPYVSFGLLAVAGLASAAVIGPIFASVQLLVPAHLRAVSIAIIFLLANLLGMGLGPLLVGMLSDIFRTWLGEDSLRLALLSLCPGYFLCSWALWTASRSAISDISNVSRAVNGGEK